MESMQEIIARRRSVRTYDEREPDKDLIIKIEQILESPPEATFGNTSVFKLIKAESELESKRRKLGTYGFISGAKWFIAGSSRPGKEARIDFGYQLEAIILQLTGLGLGTCWLGGTFSRSGFASRMGLGEGFEIPAVTPVGYAATKQGVREKIIRRMATADRRKKPEEIFCKDTLKCKDKDIHLALEAVRMAPSAENAQPWRLFRNGKQFHFYLKRSGAMFGNTLMHRLQEVDMGIAMAHWSMVLHEAGKTGQWRVIESRDWEQPEDIEYIMTWQAD